MLEALRNQKYSNQIILTQKEQLKSSLIFFGNIKKGLCNKTLKNIIYSLTHYLNPPLK